MARRSLPTGLPVDEQLVELRVIIQDRPGALVQVTTLATELAVNIADIEIADSLEGKERSARARGVARGADAFEDALVGHGYHARTALP